MTHIELPRAVEAYLAFAELPATERGRHFTITFTYMEGGRLDRLQWWWQVTRAQERAGESMIQSLRAEAIARFCQHIERWLVNGGRRLTGGEPFPQLEAFSPAGEAGCTPQPAVTDAPEETPEQTAYVDTVREFARRAAGG